MRKGSPKTVPIATAGLMLVATAAMQYAKGNHGWLPIVALVVAVILLIQAAYFWWKYRT